MNGRLKSSNGEHVLPQDDSKTIPSAQVLRKQVAAQSSSASLQPPSTSSPPSPGDYVYFSPSSHPSPSPGYDPDANRPESSAQAATRYADNSLLPLPPSRTQDNQFTHLSSPTSSEPYQRPVQHTHDTFGRTSGISAAGETQSSTTLRRKTSPTEHSAFGYLASTWIQPSESTQNDEIREYITQGSVHSHRQQRMEALEKELNLSADSSSAAGASNSSSYDHHTFKSGATSTSLPSASLDATARSNMPDRTFGRPYRDPNQPTSHSSRSRPALGDSLASQSETTSSRDTDQSNNAAYGVGEAGSVQQYAALTRNLTPDQRRQQQELDRMIQQRNLVTPVSNPTDLPSQSCATSPTSANAAHRASHQSNATSLPTDTSLASSSTPKHDVRLSRQTQLSVSTVTEQPLAPLSANDYQSDFGHRPPFAGEPAGSGSLHSSDASNHHTLPQIHQGALPTQSASVRVKPPVFGNTLAELPPGKSQSPSMVGASQETPYLSADSMPGVSAHPDSEPGPSSGYPSYAPRDPQQIQPEYMVDSRKAYAHGHPSQDHVHLLQTELRQHQATHAHAIQSSQPDGEQAVQMHDFVQADLEARAKAQHVPNLGDSYLQVPTFPPAPYSRYAQLRLPSRMARLHHTILPLHTYAHIPVTLFLDYHVIFALAQIAVHPDNLQAGSRTAWWIALGIYCGCVFIWLVGVVVIYETLWSFRRRWMVPQPLVMPIYLSAPAFDRTAIKDYSLYSLLYRARTSGSRRDLLIESFWHYSQNWPTVLTLIPRGVISAILLVLYKPSGPGLTTRGARDPYYFNQDTQRFTQFAFILIAFQAAWTACKFGVLLVANIGLVATLGFKSLVQQEHDQAAAASTDLSSFTGHSRYGLAGRQLDRQPADDLADTRDESDIHRASHRRWAWRLRAEDRIRAILFDAGLLHQTQDWQLEQKEANLAVNQNIGVGSDAFAFDSIQAHPTEEDQGIRDGGHAQPGQPSDWFVPDLANSQSQTGLALTSPEAIQPEFWSSAAHIQDGLKPAPLISQTYHVQHVESSPSLEEANFSHASDASDPYSPAPQPIGRSPRSKEQLRDASSIPSRNGHTSLHASSISSLNCLAALNSPRSASQAASREEGEEEQEEEGEGEGAATSLSAHHRSRDELLDPPRADVFDAAEGPTPHSRDCPSSTWRAPSSSLDSARDVPVSSLLAPLQSSVDAAPPSQWRGRKRPRSSPVAAFDPAMIPGGVDTANHDWPIDQKRDEEDQRHARQSTESASKKQTALDNDQSVMHAFVPMPASFMSKDPSLAGSPDQGGSDTKHGSFTAPLSIAEMSDGKPGASTATLRHDADLQNASTTSLGSSGKARLSGSYSRPWSFGNGHETSSEDGVSFEGVDGAKWHGRNSILGRIANYSSSESSRRSGSAGRLEGESWITSLFSGAKSSTSRKASAQGRPSNVGGSTGDLTALRRSGSASRSEAELEACDAVPTVITTCASTSFPSADSGSVQHYDGKMACPTDSAQQDSQSNVPSSLLMAPIGAAQHGVKRSASPSSSSDSNATADTEDSEERRLWASFPDQSRRHPPGLIALDLEQRTLDRRRRAAVAHENDVSMQQQQQQLSGSFSSQPVRPLLPGSGINLSPLMHPNVLSAIGNGAPLGLPGMLVGTANLSVSPSEGGLQAIREESWTSSLDSRSQGATGSTRSRGTASAVTASPIDAEFPIEQIQEVAIPHRSSINSLGGRGLRTRRGSS